MISRIFNYKRFFAEFESLFSRRRWSFETVNNFSNYINYCTSHRAAVKRIKNRRRK
jgi:hypothetical protein